VAETAIAISGTAYSKGSAGSSLAFLIHYEMLINFDPSNQNSMVKESLWPNDGASEMLGLVL
jgi:hypothetical protein